MLGIRKKKHHVDIGNLSVKQFRQRLFNRKSTALFGSKYTFVDDVPEQVEKLPGFTSWETLGATWDVYWVGWDPRDMKWIAGRHNSPFRQLVLPLRVMKINQQTLRMEDTHIDKKDVANMEAPVKVVIEESKADRHIAESLSNIGASGELMQSRRVEDAVRTIEENMAKMAAQIAHLKGLKGD